MPAQKRSRKSKSRAAAHMLDQDNIPSLKDGGSTVAKSLANHDMEQEPRAKPEVSQLRGKSTIDRATKKILTSLLVLEPRKARSAALEDKGGYCFLTTSIEADSNIVWLRAEGKKRHLPQVGGELGNEGNSEQPTKRVKGQMEKSTGKLLFSTCYTIRLLIV